MTNRNPMLLEQLCVICLQLLPSALHILLIMRHIPQCVKGMTREGQTCVCKPIKSAFFEELVVDAFRVAEAAGEGFVAGVSSCDVKCILDVVAGRTHHDLLPCERDLPHGLRGLCGSPWRSLPSNSSFAAAAAASDYARNMHYVPSDVPRPQEMLA